MSLFIANVSSAVENSCYVYFIAVSIDLNHFPPLSPTSLKYMLFCCCWILLSVNEADVDDVQ